jgi:hypothetical protein
LNNAIVGSKMNRMLDEGIIPAVAQKLKKVQFNKAIFWLWANKYASK